MQTIMPKDLYVLILSIILHLLILPVNQLEGHELSYLRAIGVYNSCIS